MSHRDDLLDLNRKFIEGRNVTSSSDVDAVEWAVNHIDALEAACDRYIDALEAVRCDSMCTARICDIVSEALEQPE